MTGRHVFLVSFSWEIRTFIRIVGGEGINEINRPKDKPPFAHTPP